MLVRHTRHTHSIDYYIESRNSVNSVRPSALDISRNNLYHHKCFSTHKCSSKLKKLTPMRMEAQEVKSSLLISDKHHPFVYLKIQLTFANGEETVNELTPVQFKFLVMQAIKETLGEIGASTPVDILKLWDEGLAILRVPSIEAEKIWAALTLYSTTATQKKCAFRVLQFSFEMKVSLLGFESQYN